LILFFLSEFDLVEELVSQFIDQDVSMIQRFGVEVSLLFVEMAQKLLEIMKWQLVLLFLVFTGCTSIFLCREIQLRYRQYDGQIEVFENLIICVLLFRVLLVIFHCQFFDLLENSVMIYLVLLVMDRYQFLMILCFIL
jgi:hypothetical protein